MNFDQAKLFVGGISRDTTEIALRDHFSQYGTVLDSTISIDRTTGTPRGFGFVRFSEMASADKALQDNHVVLGRTVEVKKAIPRSEQQQQSQLQSRGVSNYGDNNDCSSDCIRTKKIFVGGLPSDISEEEFKEYFERFGRITDVVVMHDSVTHRPRGFGFITFESEESVEDVLVNSFHDLNGTRVEVKRAVPKEGNRAFDGYNKLRYRNGKGDSLPFPHYGPRHILPGYTPYPWYNSNGLYVHASNTYGCWDYMDGCGGNGCALAYDPYGTLWYVPMVPSAQACQKFYARSSPTAAYFAGSGSRTRGYNRSMGSANNGFVRANVTSTRGVKQDDDSSSSSTGSNSKTSS